MSTLLKDLYSKEFFNKFSDIIIPLIPSFDKQDFLKLIFDKSWPDKELKERMRHTTLVLHTVFPKDLAKSTKLIEKIITQLRKTKITDFGLEFMFLPDYIEIYGIDHFEDAIKSIEFVTQFITCEFAVRPFIIKYGDKMLTQMYNWSLHESHHVRRLASEGSRPRLPWAMALPELKKDPRPILPILENLKNDPSEYVRRSVANNLNDIAKDNPDIVIDIAKQWKGHSKETDAIIKHGCRTLLKAGDKAILKYFDLVDNPKIEVANFKILNKKVAVGESLAFAFTIENKDKTSHSLRLEYAIYYLRQNGTLSKKVFKISEREIQPNERIDIQKKQSFKVITTRQFYLGTQKLSIIVNGVEKEIDEFELV
jgi:3-methyladenine DNA glycosylase AlkC